MNALSCHKPQTPPRQLECSPQLRRHWSKAAFSRPREANPSSAQESNFITSRTVVQQQPLQQLKLLPAIFTDQPFLNIHNTLSLYDDYIFY
jgi:hypothetical protein